MNKEQERPLRLAENALGIYAKTGFIPCYVVTEALDSIREALEAADKILEVKHVD